MIYQVKNPSEKFTQIVLGVPSIIGVTKGLDWIMHDELKGDKRFDHEVVFGSTYIRICPTKETPDRSYIAGTLLARLIKEAYGIKIVQSL